MAGYIIDPGFGIIDIPAVAEGVELAQRGRHGAGGSQRITPCIIGVRHHLRAADVDQPGHITLRVLQVKVPRAIVLHYKFTTFFPSLQPYIRFSATFSSLFRHLFLTFPPHLTDTAFLCIISKIYFKGGHTTLWIPTAAIIPVLTLPAI